MPVRGWGAPFVTSRVKVPLPSEDHRVACSAPVTERATVPSASTISSRLPMPLSSTASVRCSGSIASVMGAWSPRREAPARRSPRSVASRRHRRRSRSAPAGRRICPNRPPFRIPIVSPVTFGVSSDKKDRIFNWFAPSCPMSRRCPGVTNSAQSGKSQAIEDAWCQLSHVSHRKRGGGLPVGRASTRPSRRQMVFRCGGCRLS